MKQLALSQGAAVGSVMLLFFATTFPAWPEDAPVSAESPPAATGTEPPTPEVQERAVPRPPGFPPTLRVPARPPLPAPPQPAPGQHPSTQFPQPGARPVVPGTATGPAILSSLDAANELLAIPWQGLSKQQEQDAERNIRESLEGKRLAHGGAKLSLKGNSLAQWDFSLKMTNVGANLNFAAPPGFRSASLEGFVLEAPLGRSWEIALRGQIEGRAKVEAGGQKLLSWSPSLFPFGIRISNIQTRADVKLDPRDPERPRLVSATVTPRFSVGGEGFIPVSIPMSLQTEVSGGRLRMVGHFTDLPVSLSPLDARLTGDFILTFEPVRIDVGAQLSLNPYFLGVPQGVEGGVSTPGQQSGAGVDFSDNLADLPLGEVGNVNVAGVFFASTPFHAAFQLVTVTVRGEVSIGLGFSYLGTKYDKRVKAPFGLSLPFVVPTTDELNALIVGLQPGMPRTHGENPPTGTMPPLRTAVDFATPAQEIETGILAHLPNGTVLSLDYPPTRELIRPPARLGPPDGRSAPEPQPSPGARLQSAPPTYGQFADSAIWTGHYLAAESFRYAAQPGPEALDRVKIALAGVTRLFDVTGDAVGPPVRQGGTGELGFGRGASFVPVTVGPGILSRTVHHSEDKIDYSAGPLTKQPCYYLHPEGGWQIAGNPTVYPTYGAVPEATRKGMPQLIKPIGPLWHGWGCGANHPVSRDQYVGVFMGLAMAFQNVNDPAVRATAGRLIDDALDYLVARGRWNVILPPDNRIASTSSFLGDFPKQLAFLRIGKTVNPARWGPLYDRYARAAEFAWIPIWFSSIDPLFQYYKFNLSHAAFSPLLFLETDPAVRAQAMIGYNMLWRSVRHHRNAYFDLLHILVQAPADRAAAAATVAPGSPADRSVTLGDEIRTLLNDWLARRNLVAGPNGLPRNDVPDWRYQAALWPRDVSLYASPGAKPQWVANFPLPLTGRIGRGMDFLWQRHPFQVGMDEKVRRPGAPPPEQAEILRTGAPGVHPRREGPGVDYLIAYYLARYLGIVPAQQATP